MTVVGIHPTWRCTSPRVVAPVGLGDGAVDCHDAAVLQRRGLFISLFIYSRGGGKLCSFFGSLVYFCCMLLNMPVTKREPTPGHYDAYLVGIPKGACEGRYGQTHCKTTFSHVFFVFLVSKKTAFFFG